MNAKNFIHKTSKHKKDNNKYPLNAIYSFIYYILFRILYSKVKIHGNLKDFYNVYFFHKFN